MALILAAATLQGAGLPGINLVKSMNPSTVSPGDTVTVCLTVSAPPGTPQADIVWVLDRTGSMGTQISQVVSNINQFTSQLATTGIDYRNGLVYFPQSNNTGSVTQGWASSDAQFSSWLSTVAASTCCGTEPVLPALQAAAAMGFRPGASRTLILLTDESVDCQERNASYPLSMAGTLSALAADGFTVHAIACDCANTTTGYCYYDCSTRCNGADLPALANGLFMDISSPVSAWSGFLSQLGSAVASYSNVVLQDPIPPQLHPIPGQLGGGTLSGGTLQWTVSSLGRGDSLQRCFLSTVDLNYSGAITNSASVSADGVTPSTAVAVPIYYVTPTPSITPTSTHSPSPSASPTITPTHSITQTHTHTPTATITITFSLTATPTISATRTASATASPSSTVTPPPLTLALHPPNPNPAADEAWLPYALGTDAHVEVRVWTVSGEPLAGWPEGFQRMGIREARWDLRNGAGVKVGSGVYIYSIRAESLFGEQRKEFGKLSVLR